MQTFASYRAGDEKRGWPAIPVADLTERIQLIDALWDTVPDDALPPLSKEWLAEIQRRSAEFDSGTVRTVPWEESRAVTGRTATDS